jgi:hypothetical protein
MFETSGKRGLAAPVSRLLISPALAGAVAGGGLVSSVPLAGSYEPGEICEKVRFCQVAGCGHGKTGVAANFREKIGFYQVGAPQPRKTTVVLWGER